MYKVSKIGLLNFWLYDEEEYEFFDGKLLLRGKNGSGKSVTMQSFVPLVLDGNKTPKRLDTFGGTDKHIEYYLLGDDKDSSTGYLYMEFYDKEKDHYITIGIGLYARRGKPTDFYGFALKDGSRINKDFYLYKLKDGFNKSPLTKTELKIRLAPNNLFVDTAKDYKEMVNKLLYGFKTIESYDEFINIILQIRSPKLSKDYKPSTLMKILNDVLPPLSDEDLLPISETIESLNNTKERIDNLANKMKLLTNFIKIYRNYNESILYNKAKKYQNKKKDRDNLLKRQSENEKRINDLQTEKERLEKELTSLKNEFHEASVKKENINNSDLESKTKRLIDLEQEITTLTERQSKEEANLDDIKTRLSKLEVKAKELEDKLFQKEKEQSKILTDLEDYSSLLKISELSNMISLLLKGEIEPESILNFANDYRKQIEIIKNLLIEEDNLKLKIDEVSENYQGLQKEYNSLTEELNDIETSKEKEKDKFIETLVHNNKNNTELILLEENLKQVINVLEDFTLKNYDEAHSLFMEFFESIYTKRVNELSNLVAKKEINDDKLREETTKLDELRNKEDIELEEKELELGTNAFLDDHHISYVPFYKVIEFKDNIDDLIKNKLEANLLSTGLLGAKIIRKEDAPKLKSQNISYLIPSSKKKNNLSKFLNPVKNDKFDIKYIEDILSSISIDESETIYINDKSYSFDFLKGNNEYYESKYIGFLTRKKAKEKKIQEQESIVAELEKKTNKLENLIKITESNITKLKEEKDDFPSDKALKEIMESIVGIEAKINVVLKEQEQEETKLRGLNNELTLIIKEINNKKGNFNIALNTASYSEALENIKLVISSLSEENSILKELSSIKELIENNKEYLDSTTVNHDEIFASLITIKDDIRKRNVETNTIKEILNTKEYQELASKLKELTEIISLFPDKQSSLERSLGSIEKDIEQSLNEQEQYKNIIKKEDVLLNIYEELLEEEWSLGYTESNIEVNLENLPSLLKSLENVEGRDKSTATSNYYSGLNEYRQSLNDYAINDIQLFTERQSKINEYKDIIPIEELCSIYDDAKRQDITAIYESKKVNLYGLYACIKDEYETGKILLDESDRHLFEDILLKTVGGKIKDKINRSMEWVKEINRTMEEKQKNSNLKFSLSWLMKSKETLEEMDTKELVELFRLDPDLLKPSDSDKLIRHFRSKIASKEETMVENEETYLDIVFNILDYRTWFEFKLYYKKGEGNKTELTDKVFAVFSGGEKAKTMYIPLFASMSTKLQGAQEGAPRLIALDEAFAGVDDENIEEMFALLKSFDLDYILTSQALWCDYSEVKDISICELLGDAKTKTIGVKRYRWNGKERIGLDGENGLSKVF